MPGVRLTSSSIRHSGPAPIPRKCAQSTMKPPSKRGFLCKRRLPRTAKAWLIGYDEIWARSNEITPVRRSSYFLPSLELGDFLANCPFTTFTKRLAYSMRFLARPVSGFFFSAIFLFRTKIENAAIRIWDLRLKHVNHRQPELIQARAFSLNSEILSIPTDVLNRM